LPDELGGNLLSRRSSHDLLGMIVLAALMALPLFGEVEKEFGFIWLLNL